MGEEEDAHLEDFIQDEEAGVPVDEAGRQLLRREELGKEFNVTRERVRQIEAKALRKLRHPSRAKRLRDYLDE